MSTRLKRHTLIGDMKEIKRLMAIQRKNQAMSTHTPVAVCQCYVDSHDSSIRYCPLHTQAPAMLEALRRIIKEIRHNSQQMNSHDVIQNAEFVLAQIEQRLGP